MSFHRLFSRETRLALSATPARNLISWIIVLIPLAISLIWPWLLPWWGWSLVTVVVFVGLSVLGRSWADKDLPHDDD
ncbi:hypothetical protein AB4Z18_11360 [Leifsonia sp. 2TAF2]|uniref:hypothetical protein n=1 Tax=Leifsonia sp. 2TAF2 TaxID=3233009 RepID=UPI003F9ABDC3